MNRNDWWFFGMLAIICTYLVTLAFIGHTPAPIKPLQPQRLLKVKMLEILTGPDNQPWYLLETDDKQRISTDHYRGKVGDEFFIPSSDTNGYLWPESDPSPIKLREPGK
jgi:hypothetical protein